MERVQIFASLLVICAAATFISSQEPDLSWLRSHSAVPNEPLHARTDNYSLLELDQFRSLLDSLKSAPETTEWDGFYVSGGGSGVGFSSLRVRREVGYASLYIYTCTPELQNIDYGTIRETEDAVELVRLIPAGSPRKPETTKLIKVRWGESRFLVSEHVLGSFAEQAVGLFVIPDEGTSESQEWWNFWEKGSFDEKLIGKPQFPARYRHLERSGVTANIIGVRPRIIKSEFNSPRTYYGGESAVYRVTISAGTKQGLKKGVAFKLIATSEELVITSVGRTTSQGVIVRAINDSSRADHCRNDESQVIKCPSISRGMKVATEVGNLLF